MSQLWKLKSGDFLRGALLAVITAVLTAIIEMLKNKGLILSLEDGQQVLQIAVVAFVGYLLKNLGTDENNKILGKY